MKNKAEILFKQYEIDGDYSKLKKELLLLYNELPSLPGHIEAGVEAKNYGNKMNELSEKPNGFHEIDFYNGTIWFRYILENKNE
jgi:hypothetical protein